MEYFYKEQPRAWSWSLIGRMFAWFVGSPGFDPPCHKTQIKQKSTGKIMEVPGESFGWGSFLLNDSCEGILHL